MSPITVEQHPTGLRFRVRLQPRASRNEIAGVLDGALRVRVHAPPVDGAANDALVGFLADLFDVPRRGVRIVNGHTSRTKLIEVDGVSSADVEQLAGSHVEERRR